MRLTPIEKPPSLLGKLLDLAIRRTLGRSITPSQVIYNRVPAAWRISLAFQLYERFGAKLPRDLMLLLTTRVAMLNGCAFCVDIKRAMAIREQLGTERFDALADGASHPGWSVRERAALAFIEEATRTKHVSEATFAEVRKHFDEREIAELTLVNAIENFYNLLNLPLEVESDGLEALALASSPARPA
jgi:AhpD family alkylhydroperoxidase